MEAYTTDERLEEQVWVSGTRRAKKQEVGKAAIAFHRDRDMDVFGRPSTASAQVNYSLALVTAKVQRKSILDGMFPTDSPR